MTGTGISRLVALLSATFGAAAIMYCGTAKNDAGTDAGAPDGSQTPKVCKIDADCDAAKGEVCLSGQCKPKPECTKDADCKNNACCNLTEYKCAPCATDGGTDGSADGGGDGGCQATSDCPVTQWCDKANGGECRDMTACQIDDQCAVGHTCNAFEQACECTDDTSCAGWPDGKTECSATDKVCDVPVEPTCDPACDSSCQECIAGQCQYKSGMNCCSDSDCATPPLLSCDPATKNCIQAHVCTDACSTDQECKEWCQDMGYLCNAGTCEPAPCTADADCAGVCAPQNGTCPAGTCVCAPAAAGLCGDCSIDSTVCDAAGLKCGFLTKKCYRECQSAADCVDAAGTAYACTEILSFKLCNCNQPSCCNPPCQAGEVCDEGGTCTCSGATCCDPPCVAPETCDEGGTCTCSATTCCNPPCQPNETCDEGGTCTCTAFTCCNPPCTAPATCDEGGACTCSTPTCCTNPPCQPNETCDEGGTCTCTAFTCCNPPCTAPATCDEGGTCQCN